MMGPGMGHAMMGGQAPNSADATARLATLKAELGIRPEQTAAWNAYAATLQATGENMRTARPADMGAVHSMSPQDRQALMTGMQTRRDSALAAIRNAAEALLPALDDAQKAKAQQLLPGLAPHGPGMMRHAGMGMPFSGPGSMPAR
ncbi:Spy/CpxP family protein refolding chaperone [Sediminicoccus sp. KRV36]|uniref:Spy/CpxP family protein refolding chaperone n=1 Tax=Sediminicoccus sp. KRV36 TaxID=3133721 RepID=UPI00200CC6AE|nr:Spy/CpxP family protein refolding chaperone [Sediminicoccus rosea]UPY35615.1 Spy/CpxP family protein refolding chaperone [Sediminicoccus rosea]